MGSKSYMDLVKAGADLAKGGGPYVGPQGGKWADPAHTIPWKEGKQREHAHADTDRKFHNDHAGTTPAQHDALRDKHQELSWQANKKRSGVRRESNADYAHRYESKYHQHMAAAHGAAHDGKRGSGISDKEMQAGVNRHLKQARQAHRDYQDAMANVERGKAPAGSMGTTNSGKEVPHLSGENLRDTTHGWGEDDHIEAAKMHSDRVKAHDAAGRRKDRAGESGGHEHYKAADYHERMSEAHIRSAWGQKHEAKATVEQARHAAGVHVEVKKSMEAGDLRKGAGDARGGKYIKRIPKPGGGFTYIYHHDSQEDAPDKRSPADFHDHHATRHTQIEDDHRLKAGQARAQAKRAKEGKVKEGWGEMSKEGYWNNAAKEHTENARHHAEAAKAHDDERRKHDGSKDKWGPDAGVGMKDRDYHAKRANALWAEKDKHDPNEQDSPHYSLKNAALDHHAAATAADEDPGSFNAAGLSRDAQRNERETHKTGEFGKSMTSTLASIGITPETPAATASIPMPEHMTKSVISNEGRTHMEQTMGNLPHNLSEPDMLAKSEQMSGIGVTGITVPENVIDGMMVINGPGNGGMDDDPKKRQSIYKEPETVITESGDGGLNGIHGSSH